MEDFYEYSVKQKDGHFDLYVNDVYRGSYKTILEAADEVEKLMKEKEETNDQNNCSTKIR